MEANKFTQALFAHLARMQIPNSGPNTSPASLFSQQELSNFVGCETFYGSTNRLRGCLLLQENSTVLLSFMGRPSRRIMKKHEETLFLSLHLSSNQQVKVNCGFRTSRRLHGLHTQPSHLIFFASHRWMVWLGGHPKNAPGGRQLCGREGNQAFFSLSTSPSVRVHQNLQHHFDPTKQADLARERFLQGSCVKPGICCALSRMRSISSCNLLFSEAPTGGSCGCEKRRTSKVPKLGVH